MTTTAPLLTSELDSHAVLVSVRGSDEASDASLGELEHLLGGLGVRVFATLRQLRPEPRSALVLGRGKLEELSRLLAETAAQTSGRPLLVFDGDLTPGQQRHLARATGASVLDRTQIILRVFQRRARTRTARLEIELAALEYEVARVRDQRGVALRQGGGGGRAAKGDTSVELRKQEVRRRIAAVRGELTTLGSLRRTRQERRRDVARVALVGYTNAGKSSWMRVLTGSPVMIDDALFVTLDTTLRALHPPTTPRVVVADTVGFLRHLPNHLLASFRSTLEEALDAELLLVVVDGADPEWQRKLEITLDVLTQVGAETIPRILLLNKGDRMTADGRAEIAEVLPDALVVSARAAADAARVHARIAAFFAERLVTAELLLPFTEAALRAEIWARGRVLAEHHDEGGAHLRIQAAPALLERWQAHLRAGR